MRAFFLKGAAGCAILKLLLCPVKGDPYVRILCARDAELRLYPRPSFGLRFDVFRPSGETAVRAVRQAVLPPLHLRRLYRGSRVEEGPRKGVPRRMGKMLPGRSGRPPHLYFEEGGGDGGSRPVDLHELLRRRILYGALYGTPRFDPAPEGARRPSGPASAELPVRGRRRLRLYDAPLLVLRLSDAARRLHGGRGRTEPVFRDPAASRR